MLLLTHAAHSSETGAEAAAEYGAAAATAAAEAATAATRGSRAALELLLGKDGGGLRQRGVPRDEEVDALLPAGLLTGRADSEVS